MASERKAERPGRVGFPFSFLGMVSQIAYASGVRLAEIPGITHHPGRISYLGEMESRQSETYGHKMDISLHSLRYSFKLLSNLFEYEN